VLKRSALALVIMLVLFAWSTPAASPQVTPKSGEPMASSPTVTDPIAGRLSTTRHSIMVGGSELRYTATAGTMPLADEKGKVKGNVFFVSYTRDGVSSASERPVTFAFNGGPGSASIWLHMGSLGPKRVQMAEDGFQPAPPFRLVENDGSILDVTDVVMIDPISTGFSRAEGDEDPKQFHGVTPDIQAVAEFIRMYVTRFNRWPSPKFLFGESYGTARAAGLAVELQQRHGMELNGIVLLSAVVDYGSQEYAPGHDLAYCTYLPTLTATAWYHRRLPADLQGSLKQAVDEARAFALGEYLVALAKGSRLSQAEREAVAGKLARYTGLSERFIMSANLRVTDRRFRKELLRDRRLTVGRLDGRFTAFDADAAGEAQEFDPSHTALQGAYTAMFNDYVRGDLKFQSDLKYEVSGPVRPWSWSEFQNRYVNMTEALRSAMARNPFLKVFVANGYYDMATPFFSTEYIFDHLGFESTYAERVSMGFYEAGHMMYTEPASRRQLREDLVGFYRSAVPEK
jgi:carboxypeptidase C (cathepsin A)